MILGQREDITYGELSDFGIVNAHDLIFLARAKVESGNEVDDKQDNAASAEGVSEARDRVCQLVRKLDVVFIDPASVNLGETIQVRNVITRDDVSIKA